MSSNGSDRSKRPLSAEALRQVIEDIADGDWREDSSVTVVVEQRSKTPLPAPVRIEQASSASIRVGLGGVRIRLSQMPPWLAIVFLVAAIGFVAAVASGLLH
jgi:hypothetical protein